MADLKILTGLSASAGASISGSAGLVVQQGGLTVENGSVTLPAGSVANAALQGSGQVTVGSTAIALGATASSITGLTTVDTTNVEVTNIKAKDGSSALTIADTTGIVTVTNLTASTVAINGGAINGTTIGASTQSSAKFTTISGSGALEVGGISTLQGDVTAKSTTTLEGQVTAQNGLIVSGSTTTSGSLTIGGGGSISGPSTFTIGANSTNIHIGLGVASTTSVRTLRVNNNIIESSDGSDAITLSGSDVAVSGSLTVTGNNIKSSGGTTAITLSGADVTIPGNLTVNGTTTTINSTEITVDDKNIILGATASPTDTTANGGGITLSGSTDKTFQWVSSSNSWTSSENLDLASGKTFKINGADVLSSTTLASSVTSATGLTSIGTLSSLTVTGATKLSGAVDLGDAADDIVTVNGQLTASQGLNLGANTKIAIDSVDLIKKGTSSNATNETTGTIFKGAFGAITENTFFAINSVSSSEEGGLIYDQIKIIADNTGLGNSIKAQLNLDTQLVLKLSSSMNGDEGLSFDGTGSGSLNANGEMKVHGGGNGSVLLGQGSDTVLVKYNDAGGYFNDQITGDGYINVNAALVALSSSLENAGAGDITSTQYYSVRVAGTGSKFEESDITFELKNSPNDFARDSGNTYRFPSVSGLSSSTAGDAGFQELMERLSYASFDVAVKASGSLSTWTNDLVSVTVSGAYDGDQSKWFPKFFISAPALTPDASAKIRLIVVNEVSGALGL